MSTQKRSRVEIGRAVLRLAGEQLVPVAELVELAGAPARILVRWIIKGKGGRHLDGVHNPQRGWMSSREAVRRFLNAPPDRE